MKILSIDPSIQHVGVAIIKNKKYMDSYTIHTKASEKLEDRLKRISDHFAGLEEQFDIVLIEEADAFMRIGDYSIKNVRPVQLLMMATGVIIGSLINRYRIELVPVKDWKGKTQKKWTQIIVQHQVGKKLNDHESDAFLMATNWAQYLCSPITKRRIEYESRNQI